jgi:flagellar biosynthesis protein FlhB
MAEFERTEKATPKRRTEARKKGQVAKSREISSIFVLIAAIGVLFFLSSYCYQQLSSLMVRFFERIGTLAINPANVQALSHELIGSFFLILAPVFCTVVGVAIFSGYAQVGGVFSWELIKPDFSKIDPWKGLQRLFSGPAFVELLKSLLKIAIVGWVAYGMVKKELPNILPLMDQEVGSIFRYIGSISFALFLKTALVMALLAALDFLYQRWHFEKELRMSRQEVKDEEKQAEGDPLVKSRIRSIQRTLARKRMMAEVPKADVIITNPTHLAVALFYKNDEMAAPQVVAKGAGFVAEKIKEVGRAHQVPILENKPLAQVLFKTVEVGQAIPATLYHLVADVLAFVYRMKGKTL